MTREEIEQRTKEIMSGVFGIDADAIPADASNETIPNWDSLQHVTLTMALEQEFGVQFKIEDAFAMTTLPAICDAVQRIAAG